MFSGAGLLSLLTSIPWSHRSEISSEVRFELCPESKHGKSEISTPHTLLSTRKGNFETGKTSLYYSYSSLTNKYSSIPSFVK